jgi:DNA-binding response OmpR family regulator
MEWPMRKVLLIDDDASLRQPLAEALRDVGLEVVEACEGAHALRIQLNDPVEIVITDIFMPGEEGIETIHTLRSRYPALKIIAISGGLVQGGKYDYLSVAREIGADRVLRKPFRLAALLSAIDELVPPRYSEIRSREPTG